MILWKKLPQEVVSCEKVENFHLKLEKFNLNTIVFIKIR